MSVVGASADSPMELSRMKHAAEQRLRAGGISATIVRATAFLETWVGLLRHTAVRSGRPLVFDLARQARAALVLDTADMTFDASAVRMAFPDLPSTTLADLLTRPQAMAALGRGTALGPKREVTAQPCEHGARPSGPA